jgi:hypothetical protein
VVARGKSLAKGLSLLPLPPRQLVFQIEFEAAQAVCFELFL